MLQEVDEDDERALEMFMNHNPAPCRTLADIILEKITEKQTERQTQLSGTGSECPSTFNFHNILINILTSQLINDLCK